MTYEFKTESTYQQYFTKAHDMVRKSVREFIKKEVLPFINDWEEAGEFPVEIYKKSRGEVGILASGFRSLRRNPGDIFSGWPP
ncbi:MAG: acyl-CoA dehydrogenase family protein [Desulfobacterales bacterium]